MPDGQTGRTAEEFEAIYEPLKVDQIKDFRKAYLKVSVAFDLRKYCVQLVEEKVTGEDDASQALISPHDLDELERVVSKIQTDNVNRESWRTSSMTTEDLNNGSSGELHALRSSDKTWWTQKRTNALSLHRL